MYALELFLLCGLHACSFSVETKSLGPRKSPQQKSADSGQKSSSSHNTRYSKKTSTNSINPPESAAGSAGSASRPPSGCSAKVAVAGSAAGRRRSIGSDQSANLSQGPLANVTVLTRSKARSLKHGGSLATGGASASKSGRVSSGAASGGTRRSNSTDPSVGGATGKGGKKSGSGSVIMNTLGHIFSRKPPTAAPTASQETTVTTAAGGRKTGASTHSMNYLTAGSVVPPPTGMARFFMVRLAEDSLVGGCL